MSQTSASDIDYLRQWIGRTERSEDIVTGELVRRLRATLDQEPGTPERGDSVPATTHWCLCPAVVPMSGLGPDGHPARGGFLPPVALPRRMWAGGLLEFCDVLCVGDTVARVSRVVDLAFKEGRTGLLCFVTVEHEISTERGLAIRERQDIVYRGREQTEGSYSGAAKAPREELRPEWRRTVRPDPVLLFRYSALTFNGHRIHYDRRYCVEEEGYPGLVVHGPLQATLLAEFAAALRNGAPPSRFSFRSMRPLFDGGEFSLNAVASEAGFRLWAADQDSRVTMSAEATW